MIKVSYVNSTHSQSTSLILDTKTMS